MQSGDPANSARSIDGAGTYRIFWVERGSVTFRNLIFQHGLDKGEEGCEDGHDRPFTEQDGTLTIDTSNVQRSLCLPLVTR